MEQLQLHSSSIFLSSLQRKRRANYLSEMGTGLNESKSNFMLLRTVRFSDVNISLNHKEKMTCNFMLNVNMVTIKGDHRMHFCSYFFLQSDREMRKDIKCINVSSENRRPLNSNMFQYKNFNKTIEFEYTYHL